MFLSDEATMRKLLLFAILQGIMAEMSSIMNSSFFLLSSHLLLGAALYHSAFFFFHVLLWKSFYLGDFSRAYSVSPEIIYVWKDPRAHETGKRHKGLFCSIHTDLTDCVRLSRGMRWDTALDSEGYSWPRVNWNISLYFGLVGPLGNKAFFLIAD